MGGQLHILFHGLTVFVDRGRYLEACLVQPASRNGLADESFHAVLLTERSTVVPMQGNMELILDRVVTPRYPTLRGAEQFLLDAAVFDSQEREVDGRILLPLPNVIASAHYQFHGRPIVMPTSVTPPPVQPSLAHILIYQGVERAELRRAGRRMWEMPSRVVPGVRTDQYIGPVFPPN
ncbi:MAG: hypothetical protein JNK87_11645 [Bryobacterales bacterium]|nr:hypothetical protein [Bryobacterales bacterium]